MALYNAFLYGNTQILCADFKDHYNQSVQIVGLNYISNGISSGLAIVIYTTTFDHIYRAISKRNGGQGKPYFRIPVMVPGTLLLDVGLFSYCWLFSVRSRPTSGCAMFVAGVTVCTSSVNTYIIDTYGQYSASVIAAISILRCLAGFTFPMFPPTCWPNYTGYSSGANFTHRYDRFGYSWAATVLSHIALGIGLSAVGLLWQFGSYLKQRSPYPNAKKVTEHRTD
ncbi:polyamine transporter 3 [Colletotrichum incanum]|uniref:Polyamine transporter 3 n=1 Tax=Colletotrichum incanum TaxID=1573173 RepID=A0A162PDG5_COLIC|nr:polyamine transporter 3 [Colletotrichum incanum]